MDSAMAIERWSSSLEIAGQNSALSAHQIYSNQCANQIETAIVPYRVGEVFDDGNISGMIRGTLILFERALTDRHTP
jgi:hypothetical protein